MLEVKLVVKVLLVVEMMEGQMVFVLEGQMVFVLEGRILKVLRVVEMMEEQMVVELLVLDVPLLVMVGSQLHHLPLH
jgi:hypothetical protein